MQVELKAIQREVGITFVFVTHDQEEALTLSDRVAVFNRGRIEQVGSPREVYGRPATAFVAGFVGTSNLLDGDVAQAVLGKPGTFTVRPEKIRMQQRAGAVAHGADGGDHGEGDVCRATGTVREVVYLGAATQSVVDLDAGGTLIVLQQNLQGSIEDRLGLRGSPVLLTWRRQDTVAIGAPA
jgi:putative spermidine/putrescine transport system ATP-binding protein